MERLNQLSMASKQKASSWKKKGKPAKTETKKK
jgi:hypothetical protein